MLCKSSTWELGLIHYITNFTISRFVISRFECTWRWTGIVKTFRTRLYVLLHDCMISLLQRIELARDFRQKEDSSFCECNSYAISKNE